MPYVFISYAREDIEIAKRLRNDLLRAGVTPWLDKFDLLPGEHWRVAIRKAIKMSSFFVALLSKKSVGKRGFVQKELREALSVAEEFPQDEVFIIPVRIDECDPSYEDLQALQRVDLFPSYYDGLRTLRQVLKSEYEQEYGGVARQGRIARMDRDRGFGFIQDDEFDKDLFFLFKDFITLNLPFIAEGMYVRYQFKPGPMGPVAMEITLT